jgi:hypothetical protein
MSTSPAHVCIQLPENLKKIEKSDVLLVVVIFFTGK